MINLEVTKEDPMKKLLLTPLALLLVISCASTTKEIEAEKAQVAPVSSRVEMQDRTRSLINNSEKLTATQKADFLNLHSSVMTEMTTITDDMRKLKVVMMNNLANKDYDQAKMIMLEKRIKKLNSEKMDLMIKAMNQAKIILGVEFQNIYPEIELHRERF
jgi:protein subunit release factor A